MKIIQLIGNNTLATKDPEKYTYFDSYTAIRRFLLMIKLYDKTDLKDEGP